MLSLRPAVFASVLLAASPAFADVSEGLALLEEGNVQEAASSFQAAYEAGDGDGAFYLGRLFEVGAGVEANPVRAANLYAAGVEKGSTLAMNRLGILYQEGNVLLRDYAEAAKLLCQAADAGDANGQFNCGLAYYNGQGVQKDVARVISLWEGAAKQDNIAAQNFLGQIYLNGDEAADIAVDTAKARGYFEQTAEAGNALGLYQLAQLDAASGEDGETPVNAVEAYKYASLAAVRGLRDAAVLRDRLEAGMSSEDVLAAQAAAKSWTEVRLASAENAGGVTLAETAKTPAE